MFFKKITQVILTVCHSETCLEHLVWFPTSFRWCRFIYCLFVIPLENRSRLSVLFCDDHAACFWWPAFTPRRQGLECPLVSLCSGANVSGQPTPRRIPRSGNGHLNATKIPKLLFQLFRSVWTPIWGQEELLLSHFLSRFRGTQLLQFF